MTALTPARLWPVVMTVAPRRLRVVEIETRQPGVVTVGLRFRWWAWGREAIAAEVMRRMWEVAPVGVMVELQAGK